MVVLIPILLFLAVAIVLIHREIQDDKLLKTVTNKNRGTWSERDLILNLLKNGISSESIFHDLYVQKSDGGFSQVDVVILTDVGLIVVEVKHLSGWIFGTGTQSKWVQLLAYGKEKYFFYNPVFQNSSHIKFLRHRLSHLGEIPIYSLIVFYGDNELKKISDIPNDVAIVKSRFAIEAIQNIINNESQKISIDLEATKAILSESVKNGDDSNIRLQHIENIRTKLNS